MRVLFTSQPAVGHFHPLVPLAQALVAAGHDVAVACAPAFSPTVAASGLRPLPAGLDWLEEDNFERHFPGLAGMPPGPGRVAWIMANVFAGVTAERMVADLRALAATWPFDLVVRETQEYGGCLAAERLGPPTPSSRLLPRDRMPGISCPSHSLASGRRSACRLTRSSRCSTATFNSPPAHPCSRGSPCRRPITASARPSLTGRWVTRCPPGRLAR